MVDHAPDACARRGGDGFALVLHTAGPAALGGSGAGLGYAGLPNGIALEFDTWADADASDPGDNHVALITRGDFTLRCLLPPPLSKLQVNASACVLTRTASQV